MAVAFWNQWNEAKMRIWGNERNNCKMRLFLWNDPQIAWMRLKWSYHSRLIYIILEWLEWGSNERMKKILQNKTASQEWLPNCLNETEMRGMKEILGPESNLGGLKSRLPIGREPKIVASDWSRADDFENSSHRPFFKKSLSFHLFRNHSGVFGVTPETKTHFAVILLYIRLILPANPWTKQV